MRILAAAVLSVCPGWTMAGAAQYAGYVVDVGDVRAFRGGKPISLLRNRSLQIGDSLSTVRGGVVFEYCPQKSEVTLAPNSDVTLGAKGLAFGKGRAARTETVESCSPVQPELTAQSNVHPSIKDLRTPRKSRGVFTTVEPISPVLRAELDRIKDLDLRGRISRAVLYEQYGQPNLAIEEYKSIQGEWPEVAWIKEKIQSITAQQTAGRPPADQPKIYALVVGISSYELVPKLNFAHTDAQQFAAYLKTPRGGAVPSEDILLLTNTQATTAAIRFGLATFFKGKATPDDTVVLYFAAHGMRKTSGAKEAFILTYDSDPQDPDRTALPMADLEETIRQELGNIKRVLLFLDTCHAGSMGPGRTGEANSELAALGRAKVFGMLASRSKEKSAEGAQYGEPGHGAFTYYLMKGLNGAAGSQLIEFGRAFEYVQREVPLATGKRQHPSVFGSPENNLALADVRLPGLDPDEPVIVLESGGHAIFRGLLGSAEEMRSPEMERFRQAIERGRIRRADPDSAFLALEELRAKLPPDQVFLLETELRVVLEDEGQKIMLRYLAGDQSPQRPEDFFACATYFRDARWFVPDSPFLEARELFCQGRALLFDKGRYDEAFGLLQQSIERDPNAAYTYNALGIGYLEHGDYPRAIQAFLDAITLAPFWAYPHHNLALAQIEDGDYEGAIRAYQDGIAIAPQYSYLHYNLGLLYHRLNRRWEAERAFDEAIKAAAKSAPNSAKAYNAMGSLMMTKKNWTAAEENFKLALAQDPALLPARHNQALLLARKDPGAAMKRWREILKDHEDFQPSRFSLAEALADQGQKDQAIEQYLIIASSGSTAACDALYRLLNKR